MIASVVVIISVISLTQSSTNYAYLKLWKSNLLLPLKYNFVKWNN